MLLQPLTLRDNGQSIRVDSGLPCGAVPRAPGIYLFCDERDTVIYVGKSNNLRHRISSYFGRSRSRLEDRTRRMIYHARRLQLHQIPTELLGLLLEDKLIKQHQPRYNIRQNTFAEHRYLGFTRDPFPTLVVTREREPGCLVSFGPYRSRYVAEEIRHLICRWFRLRPCSDPDPRRKCPYLELYRCAGPCNTISSTAAYAQAVSRAIDFLAGRDALLLDRMMAELATHSQQLRYEKAAEILSSLKFCHHLFKRQRFFRSFISRSLHLRDKGASGGTYLFVRGQLYCYQPGSVPENAIRDLLPAAHKNGHIEPGFTEERFLLDRAAIVQSWIDRLRCEHRFLDE